MPSWEDEMWEEDVKETILGQKEEASSADKRLKRAMSSKEVQTEMHVDATNTKVKSYETWYDEQKDVINLTHQAIWDAARAEQRKHDLALLKIVEAYVDMWSPDKAENRDTEMKLEGVIECIKMLEPEITQHIDEPKV